MRADMTVQILQGSITFSIHKYNIYKSANSYTVYGVQSIPVKNYFPLTVFDLCNILYI